MTAYIYGKKRMAFVLSLKEWVLSVRANKEVRDFQSEKARMYSDRNIWNDIF